MTIELPTPIARFLKEDAAANHTTATAWICRAIALARRARRGDVTINNRKVVLL